MKLGDDRGSVTVFVVGTFLALMVTAGLVFDGGSVVVGHREADAEAEGAARAAAERISIPALRSGQTQLDPAEAKAAAESYLAQYGHAGAVQVNGDNVTVTVRYPVNMQILDLFGVDAQTVTGTATATAVEGPFP